MRKFYHKLWISICLILSMGLWYICPTVVQAMPALTEEEDRVAIPIETNSIENWPEGPVVTSQSAILIDAETGVILYAKNIHEQLYPASTTKLLTCLIATEQCSMDEIVTFSHDAIFDTPRDSSHIALDEGNQLTLEQCLNAILIASANEVSFGVAEHVTGTSWEDFAPLMNERATELGCVDSNFVNPNGLPDENH
ncbi:MAG: D-alanyl-D-alanine carboxypeptidase, partial [Lachnospiraceae bacterium]|nr:D-alanyl-D-alanine carboxypeptidase [Lachnospiraceae bacterium]